jgi:hypothetical protein
MRPVLKLAIVAVNVVSPHNNPMRRTLSSTAILQFGKRPVSDPLI